MVELFALAALAIAGLAAATVITFVFVLIRVAFWLLFLPVKLLFWVLFLPFRLLFKLMWLPAALVLGTVGLTIGLAAVPLVIAAVIVSLVVALVGILIPLLPFVLLGLVIWALFRRTPAAPPTAGLIT